VLLTPASARAETPPVWLEGGVRVGVGSKLNDFGGGAANPKGGPLGAGIGFRTGISAIGFYGGITALYYLGTEQDSAPTTLSAHSVVWGFEAGYELFPQGPLVVRLQLGLGGQTTHTSAETPGIATMESTKTYFYLEPGVTALFVFETYFVGADVNAYVLPYVPRTGAEGIATSSFATGITAHGLVGVRF
jgi:hypothetical protein